MVSHKHSVSERLFNGVCVTCMRHWKCPKAEKKLNLEHCNAYKLSKSSNEYKRKQEEQNGGS